jgi:hypothetical protein
MWIILIILVVVALYFLNKKNENMSFNNRLTCDNDPKDGSCFAENLTGTEVTYKWQGKKLKLYLMKSTLPLEQKDLVGGKVGAKNLATRPTDNFMIKYFRNDFKNFRNDNFRNNMGDFNLIVYEMKYIVESDTRFAYIAVLYTKDKLELFNNHKDKDYFMPLCSDPYFYSSFINLTNTNDRIIDDNSGKDNYNTFITLSNASEILEWSFPKKNVFQIKGKTTGSSNFDILYAYW